MNPPEEKDPIDTQLREQDVYINDDGFTARVVATLPPRRRAWLGPAILLGAVAIGTVLAVRWLPWGNLTPLDLSAVLSLDSQVLLPWMLVLSVAASLVWAVLAAVGWDD
jgi:hypothetical protein